MKGKDGEEKMGKDDKKRRVYTRKFKIKAVALAEKHRKPVSQVALDLGINENMLYRWIQQARGAAGTGLPPFSGHEQLRDGELSRLRKEAKALKRANELLKKQSNFSSHHLPKRIPLMVYQFMKENQAQYTIRKMAEVFGLSCSAYYKWAKHDSKHG
jgi:transposase